MLKQRIICILGLFTAIFPFFGIPLSWKKIILFIVGLGIFAIGYLLYRERRAYMSALKNTSHVFAERRPDVEEQSEVRHMPRVRRRAPKREMPQAVEEQFTMPTASPYEPTEVYKNE
jgi:hypothetical protein